MRADKGETGGTMLLAEQGIIDPAGRIMTLPAVSAQLIAVDILMAFPAIGLCAAED